MVSDEEDEDEENSFSKADNFDAYSEVKVNISEAVKGHDIITLLLITFKKVRGTLRFDHRHVAQRDARDVVARHGETPLGRPFRREVRPGHRIGRVDARRLQFVHNVDVGEGQSDAHVDRLRRSSLRHDDRKSRVGLVVLFGHRRRLADGFLRARRTDDYLGRRFLLHIGEFARSSSKNFGRGKTLFAASFVQKLNEQQHDKEKAAVEGDFP